MNHFCGPSGSWYTPPPHLDFSLDFGLISMTTQISLPRGGIPPMGGKIGPLLSLNFGQGQTWVRSRSRLWLHEASSQASGSRLRLPDFKKAWLWLWFLTVRKSWLRLWLRVCGFSSVWYIIPPVDSCCNDMYCFL